MVNMHIGRWVVFSGVVWLAAGSSLRAAVGDDPPPLAGPVTSVARADRAASLPPLHEALSDSEHPADRILVTKAPPPPIAERPTSAPPDARAQWVAGYWGWDPARDDFVWVGGRWVVPPPGRIWVNGRWERDARGWTRVAGVWSPRREPERDRVADDWRKAGPPSDHPDDTPGPAPDASVFYVPGHYAPAPDGARLAWTPGFWARPQPGWDWIPARWVRRPDGWEFRAGYWTRERERQHNTDLEPRRHVVARPRPPADPSAPGHPDLPPAIIESEPAEPDRAAAADRVPPPPRDPIAEGEDLAPAPWPVPPVVVVPRSGRLVVPYPYVAPPYPYGPGVYPPSGKLYDPYGYVGASVPPAVRRLLDRILP